MTLYFHPCIVTYQNTHWSYKNIASNSVVVLKNNEENDLGIWDLKPQEKPAWLTFFTKLKETSLGMDMLLQVFQPNLGACVTVDVTIFCCKRGSEQNTLHPNAG